MGKERNTRLVKVIENRQKGVLVWAKCMRRWMTYGIYIKTRVNGRQASEREGHD